MSVPFDQPVRLTFDTFSDAAETIPADPTAITLDILDPAAVTTTHNWPSGDIVRDSLGVFHFDVTPATAGHYVYHWKATGAVATALDGSFDVLAKYDVGLVNLADAKAQLGIIATDTSQDAELQGFVDAATAVVEGIVGPVVQRSITEVHSGGGPFIVLNNPPIISVTSVTEMVGPTAYTLTDAEFNTTTGAYSYSVDSYERGVIARRWSGGIVGPFVGGVRNIQVVYVAGRASVPPAVRLGALLLIEHLWEQTQRGNSTNQPVPGTEMDADLSYGASKQTQAMSMLAPYRKAPALA